MVGSVEGVISSSLGDSLSIMAGGSVGMAIGTASNILCMASSYRQGTRF
ncbi:MAG: hypothetical protein RMJ36_02495 [Candidatus Calescibacterium sp.]|nr:hypothetical protein [Candidatus Calescibacterium sp.]MDW8132508.1 hypothetical protein [Candidatus Calescibacterium sp.]